MDRVKEITTLDDTEHSQLTEIRKLAAENARLGNEGSAAAILLAKRELELAECKYHLKKITAMHEDITTSTVWKCIKPLRTVLKIIKKTDFSAGNAAEYLSRVAFRIATKPGRSGLDWVEAVNGSSRQVAIVLSGCAGDDAVKRWSVSLARFLAGHGYLVIHAAWRWNAKETLHDLFSAADRDVIQIPLSDLVNNADRLRLQKGLPHACFVTLPTKVLSGLLPSFRLAGFSIVYNILTDWELRRAAGQAVGYEKECEAQVVLSADVVAVMSASLKHKFSSLRGDIVTLGTGCSPDSEGLDSFLERGSSNCLFSQLIAETENKSVIKNIYA